MAFGDEGDEADDGEWETYWDGSSYVRRKKSTTVVEYEYYWDVDT